MNEKKYLIEQIKKCKRKMNLAKLLDCGILFTALGGVAGILCEMISLVWQFYYVNLAAGLCFAAGCLAGIAYGGYKRADMARAASRLDSFGLKERMITAYEQAEREDEFARLQRQDALFYYNQARGRIKISLIPDKRHVLALLLSAAAVIGMSFIPSPVRDQAQLRHRVQEQAKEEQEKLEEFLDALEGVDPESLTEEQKLALQELAEMMERSREELERADSWESLASATERLSYKYDQAGQSLESLSGQIKNPEEAGVAAAEAFAKAAADQDGQQTASAAGTAGAGNKDGQGEDAGNGDGQGEDAGNGDGQGEGAGNGDGNGQGSGSGGGRGTGSSSAAHDYVSIPNGIAEDPSLTGEKNNDQDSDYYRQQNGLAWEGNHVDYSSVIGEYTDNAYEGIANGRYPSGMEPVIRDYFESLNQ